MTKRADQMRRRAIRDAGAYKDPLPLSRLKELLALWEGRLKDGSFSEKTCRNMIELYTGRIARTEGANRGTSV